MPHDLEVTRRVTPETILAELHRDGVMSTRGFWGLRAAGAATIGDAARIDLSHLPNVGSITRREIEELLRAAGLEPHQPPPRPARKANRPSPALVKLNIMAWRP